MHNNDNFISIITAHFNDISGLLKTYESLKFQSFKNWRWIIVDSFTNDFLKKLPKSILKNKNIEILQLHSSIYDAMNFGLFKVSTDYFHFLNCNSTYCNNSVLEEIYKIIKYDFKNKKSIYTTQLVIENRKNYHNIQKPSRYFYPFKSGHESTIFPSIKKNKIIINSFLGVTADIIFMNDYSNCFKVIEIQIPFINYPKGGYSDSDFLIKEKFTGYFKLLLDLLIRNRILSLTFCIYRILSLCYEYLRNKKLNFSKLH